MPCAVRIIIFKRESLNYLLASFTRCTLPFQCVCFLLPICLPCVSCGTYCNAHKCYAVTHRAADIRVAWLVYVRTYCVPIATLYQNKRTLLLYLGDAQIIKFSTKPSAASTSMLCLHHLDLCRVYDPFSRRIPKMAEREQMYVKQGFKREEAIENGYSQ